MHPTPTDAAPLSVVVLTYNSAATLERCLASVCPQVTELGGQVLVVDNASDDASTTIARGLGVEVVETGDNLGFAAGCNIGARHTDGRLLVFVNPDAELDDNCLARLVEAADADPRRGPLGGRARLADDAYDPRCRLSRPRLRSAVVFALGLGTLLRRPSGHDPEHGPLRLPADGAVHEVPAVSGALMAVPRDLWTTLGGFDERYFLYGEDVDLCVRAAGVGATPVQVAPAGYRHVGGIAGDGSPQRRALLHRGKAQLYRDHLSPARGRVALWALQTGALLRGLPALVPVAPLARRARPWWRLFRERASWREGHPPSSARTASHT